jgi:hypothetical protein
MACSLNDDGLKCTAKTGSVVKVCVLSSATNLVSATYPDGATALTVAGDCTTFTVVAGNGLLVLNLAGPGHDSVEIVEDCGGGQTQHLFGYHDDFHPALVFPIVGN